MSSVIRTSLTHQETILPSITIIIVKITILQSIIAGSKSHYCIILRLPEAFIRHLVRII